MTTVSRPAARRVPASRNKKMVARLRKAWTWRDLPADAEDRHLITARWDSQLDQGFVCAAPEFWVAVHEGEDEAVSALLQVQSEGDIYHDRTASTDVPEAIGARLAPPDPTAVLKGKVQALLNAVVATPDKSDERMGDYAELREQLQRMQQAVLEAEGMLDVVRERISAPGRAAQAPTPTVGPTFSSQ